MIEQFCARKNLPQFRLKQFWKQYYVQAVGSVDELTTWPLELREELKQNGPFLALELVKEYESFRKDTVKVLFKRHTDGNLIESVLMQHQDGRNTVCVSCMIGCPVGCAFCATGKMGFIANLTADEIVEQVLYFQRKLLKKGARVSNVVFMGMGEPLLNLDEVLAAIAILTDPEKVALSERRISISTSGYIKQLPKLLEAGFKGKLAISLHAPEQELRAKLMPVARINPLPELMQALDEYTKVTNKRVFYEYLLLENVNDSEAQALKLAKLLHKRLAHVNLIPFNYVPGSEFQKSTREHIDRFLDVLSREGVSATVRVSMGSDIAGACGQLVTQAKK